MKHPRLILVSALVMTAFLVGCRGGARPPIFDAAPSQPMAQEEAEDPWYALQPEFDEADRPKFITERKARKCPRLTVSLLGQTGEIDPGLKGSITIVVFWSMDYTFTRAAVRHVRDLAHKYAGAGVRAIGIVENTKTAGAARGFLRSQGMSHSSYGYLDDFTALRKMGKAARESGVEQVPCFFIVDRNRRVRFFKRGFAFVSSAVSEEWQDRLVPGEEIIENAPPGEHIEDYLVKLLSER